MNSKVSALGFCLSLFFLLALLSVSCEGPLAPSENTHSFDDEYILLEVTLGKRLPPVAGGKVAHIRTALLYSLEEETRTLVVSPEAGVGPTGSFKLVYAMERIFSGRVEGSAQQIEAVDGFPHTFLNNPLPALGTPDIHVTLLDVSPEGKVFFLNSPDGLEEIGVGEERGGFKNHGFWRKDGIRWQ